MSVDRLGGFAEGDPLQLISLCVRSIVIELPGDGATRERFMVSGCPATASPSQPYTSVEGSPANDGKATVAGSASVLMDRAIGPLLTEGFSGSNCSFPSRVPIVKVTGCPDTRVVAGTTVKFPLTTFAYATTTGLPACAREIEGSMPP